MNNLPLRCEQCGALLVTTQDWHRSALSPTLKLRCYGNLIPFDRRAPKQPPQDQAERITYLEGELESTELAAGQMEATVADQAARIAELEREKGHWESIATRFSAEREEALSKAYARNAELQAEIDEIGHTGGTSISRLQKAFTRIDDLEARSATMAAAIQYVLDLDAADQLHDFDADRLQRALTGTGQVMDCHTPSA